MLRLVAVIRAVSLLQPAGTTGQFLFQEMTHGDVQPDVQKWRFLSFFIASHKGPLWPFHTWLPDAANGTSPDARAARRRDGQGRNVEG